MACSEVKKVYMEHPVAVIECFEEIPCNPCQTCCKQHAITFSGGTINSTPKLDASRCTGCGLCIATCPGQAIFVLDGTFSETEGLVSIPYEFLPLPQKGQAVDVMNRDGQVICIGEIHRVLNPASFNSTAVVTMRIPKEYMDQARSFRY